MSTTDPASGRPGDDGPTDHESVADDRFMHGLLGFVHRDTDEIRNDRVDAALDRIGRRAGTRRSIHRLFMARLLPLATAAVLTIAVMTVFVLSPQPSAQAMVGQAIRATQLAPELRYEVRITDPARDGDREQTLGSIDMRGDLLLVRIRTHEGHDFVMGRDGLGEWSLRRDGGVERFDPRAAAPRWINMGDSTILVGGLDALLDELRDDDYSIGHAENADRSATDGKLTHLVATRRKGAAKPGADRIHVWIDNDTSLVERLELRWTRAVPLDQRPDAPRPGGAAERGGPPPPPRSEPPRLLHEQPRFQGNGLPPPPELIVFERVAPADLSDEQFSPPAP